MIRRQTASCISFPVRQEGASTVTVVTCRILKPHSLL
ncbi:hypothetical protein FKM82_008987 [Ascaphus truei]